MALHTDIDSFYKEPSCTVTVGGTRLRDVVSVDVGHSMSELSSATIRMLSNNSIKPNDKVVVKQGYGGQEVVTFTGSVDDVEWSEDDEVFSLTARDVLKTAIDTFLVQEVMYGLDVDQQMWYYSEYTTTSGGMFETMEYGSIGELTSAHPDAAGYYSEEGVMAHFVVKKLLTLSGLNEHEINVGDTQFWIGDVSPAKFHLESVFDACNRIADLIGWNIYADVSGTVHFNKRPRMQNDAAKIWTYKANKSPYNVNSLSYNTSNTDLRNYVEVHGHDGIKVVKRIGSPYISPTPYKGVLIGNDLIDTSGMAQFFAHRVLEDLSRLHETVNLGMDGNPYLFPRFSVYVDSSKFTGTVLIEGVSSSMSADSGYTMTLDGRAFVTPIEDLSELPADIVPVIGIEQCVVIGDPTYLTLFTGLASYSYAGPIVSYAWEFPDGPSIGGTAWRGIQDTEIMDGNVYPVTLTVTDLQGNVGTVTSGFTLESLRSLVDIKYRHLYAALTDRAVGSEDGGNEWRTNASIPATAVAASNFAPSGQYVPSGYALFGDTSGTIWRTYDVCATFEQVFAVPDGSTILDLHIPEMDYNYALASTESGKVYASEDLGTTWEEIGSFDVPVYQVRHAWDNFEYVMVVASGAGQLYHSFNRGADWLLDEGPTEGGVYVINWNAPGSASNYYVHSNGIIAYEYNTTKHDLTFSGGVPGPFIAGTVNVDNNAHLMAADTGGQLWSMYSGGVPADTITHMVPAANMSLNKVRHMLRDGEVPVVYHATQSGMFKSFDWNKTIHELYVPSGQTMPNSSAHTVVLGLGNVGFGEQVAYGPLVGEPVPRGRLLLSASDVTWKGSGAPKSGTFISRGRYKWERVWDQRVSDFDLTVGPDVVYIIEKDPHPEATLGRSGKNYVVHQVLIDPVGSGITFNEDYWRFPEVNHGQVEGRYLAAPGVPRVVHYSPTSDSLIGVQSDWQNGSTDVVHYNFRVTNISKNPTHEYKPGLTGRSQGMFRFDVSDLSPNDYFVFRGRIDNRGNQYFLWNYRGWDLDPLVIFDDQDGEDMFPNDTAPYWAIWDDTDMNTVIRANKVWEEGIDPYNRYFYVDDPGSFINSNNELLIAQGGQEIVGVVSFHRFPNTVLVATESTVYKILDRGLREEPEIVFELPEEAGDFPDNKIIDITCSHGYGGFTDYVVIAYRLDIESPLLDTHNQITFVLSTDWGKTWEIIAEVNLDIGLGGSIGVMRYIPPSWNGG